MVADIFLHPLLFLLLLGNLIYLDWKLTLFAFAALPVIVVILKSIAKSVRKYSPLGFQQLESMTSVIKETLDGIRIIQSFNLGTIISKKFERLGQEFTDSRKMMHSRGELAGPMAEMIATLIFMMVIFYITQKVAAGEATTGSFLAYTTSILMLNPSLKRAQETYVRIQEVIVAAGRVYQIIEAPHEVHESTKNLDFPKDWKKIKFNNICLFFDEKKVLDHVSLEVNRGETIALVGESGSGKSSLLNLLLRFYEPSAGEILIDNEPIQSFNLLGLRKNIALVSQDVFLFNDSITANIQSGDLTRPQAEIERVAKLANAHDFISKMPKRYDTYVGDRGGLLSGGEKQRVSIARALFKDSPILILDEATSALDSTNEAEVQKGLDTLMEGRTTFVVAHRLSTIQNVDRIYVVKLGRLVEVGTHENLISKQGEYFKFYQLQGGAFTQKLKSKVSDIS
jgi:ATP-binding cassette subfamily B protein/subfamily B ATP-binding cassette protein MsbA